MIFINKRKQLFEEIDDLDRFDLIYFDALVIVQPELWSTAIFKKKCLMHLKQWVLVTYNWWCSERSMIEVGFKVEKGHREKREMFRANLVN
jgi:tRNA U34 5-methylaminomethyl-2-thiouridine-forming methyltransferase MnmC